MRKSLLGIALACTTAATPMALAANALTDKVIEKAASVHQQAIEWRHDIHQHPELGNQEHRTAELVAEHLRSLGMEVQTDVGTTGVVGVLKGGKPGLSWPFGRTWTHYRSRNKPGYRMPPK